MVVVQIVLYPLHGERVAGFMAENAQMLTYVDEDDERMSDRSPGICKFHGIFRLSGHGGEEGGDVTRQDHAAVVEVGIANEDGAGG